MKILKWIVRLTAGRANTPRNRKERRGDKSIHR